jgi:hypothetical protein
MINVILLKHFRNLKISISCLFFFFCISIRPIPSFAAEWQHFSTDDFHFIYQKHHESLVPRILTGAQTSLRALKKILHYEPTEIITVVIRDNRDIGSARATALPHNRVIIDIAPFNQADYESVRFDEQFQWLLSHELVHVVIADQASSDQINSRDIFGKVMPDKSAPLTLPFSLLTNQGRFTPTWYQEGIAEFMETWLNGGYGRVLGSYDEMYFRTLSYENVPLMNWQDVDFNDDSFLLGTSSYLYGARFMAHLAIHYGVEDLLRWVSLDVEQGYIHFYKKFQQIFATTLEAEWDKFKEAEEHFQKENLNRIRKYPITFTNKITEPLGWVTRGYAIDDNNLLFATLRPHHFSSIEKLDLKTGKLTEVYTLHTPKLLQVTSTAFDKQKGLFFYTTHNNMGYRDLWSVDINSKKSKRLFKDARMGDLSINPLDHTLWGVQTQGPQIALAFSPLPYDKVKTSIVLPIGTILSHLNIHPDGKSMLATLRIHNGKQSIVLIDLVALQKNKRFLYTTVSNNGNPEHASWGTDGKIIYWNAYTSGVSNIFRKQINTNKIEVLSNIETGLFHPLVLDKEHIFSFQFTNQGFQPVITPNTSVEGVAAIHYRGQSIIEKHPELREWRLQPEPKFISKNEYSIEKYNGFSNLQKAAFIPTIESYAKQTAIGFYWEMKDPLDSHQISINSGISKTEDINSNSEYDFHLNSTYNYLDTLIVNLQHLPTSFYDLANQRDIRRVNNGLLVEYKKHWLFDRPKTFSQWFFIGSNEWKFDDFGQESTEQTYSYGTQFKWKNLRRTIGNTGYEKGITWNAQLRKTHLAENSSINTTQLFGDINWLTPIFKPHNIFRIQAAAGKTWGDFIGEGRFYFEGFGRQLLEEETSHRYRQLENLAGLSDNSQIADRFRKFTVENTFPSFKIKKKLGDTYLKRGDISIFHQRLYSEFENNSSQLYNIGFQSNLYFTNFHLISSTLSFGYAHAVDKNSNEPYNELFIYLKLFRN